MAIWNALLEAGRELTVVTERVDRLRAEVDSLSGSVVSNTERLIGNETLIDMARDHRRRLSRE